jgi:glucokinase
MIGAVDIGGTKIAAGMVNDNGQVLSRKETPTDTESYANGLAAIASMLRETARTAGVEFTGIGIGSTGPVVSPGMAWAEPGSGFGPHVQCAGSSRKR